MTGTSSAGRRTVLGAVAGVAGSVLLNGNAQAAPPPGSPGSPSSPGPSSPPPRSARSIPAARQRFSVAGADTYNIGRIAGTDSMNQTGTRWQVGGTDLGSMFEHKGRLVFLFGDTEAPPPTQDHRDNVLAWSVDTNPADGITFEGMIEDQPGHAKELLDHGQVGAAVTVIPTNGIAIGDRMVMHYMGVDQWGEPGRWTLNRSGMAFSDDDGNSWVVSDSVTWPDGGGNFGQVALVNDGDHTYLFGIPGGRFGGIALGRVPVDALLEMAAYEYLLPDGSWGSDPAAASIIVPAPVGELTVQWNSHYNSWLLMYLNETKAAVVLRTAETLTGPWSEELTVVTAQDFPELYAPFIPPRWNDGPDIYFALSQFTPYSVHWWHTSLQG